MADTSFFSIGCMKRRHAVILESIWETDSIITHFLAQRTGLLTLLLTCFTLLSFSFLLAQTISSPTPFLPFSFLDRNFLSPIPLPFSPGHFLSPTSILKNYSKTILNSVLAAKSFHSRKNILSPILFLTWKNSLFLPTNCILLPPESKRCPLTLPSALACADSVDELWLWNKSES